MYLRFFKFLYFMPDESVHPWINKDYLLTYFLICDTSEKHDQKYNNHLLTS